MSKKAGFTILEMLVAIAIIGILATAIIPNMRRSKPKEVRETFLGQLNGLLNFSWQQAIKTRKIQKVEFDFKKKEVRLFVADKKDKYGKMQFAPLRRTYIKSYITIPEQLEVQSFYIDGKEQVSVLGKESAIYFFISQGLSQAVVINFLDKEDKINRRKRPIGLVLNPFSAQFEVYNEFKKP